MDAVEPGQLLLHDDEIRLESLGSRDRLWPVPGLSEDAVTQALELLLQASGDEVLGLDDEDLELLRASTVEGHHCKEDPATARLTIRYLP